MRPDRLRLLDALEQIELIRKFAAPGREAFFGDALSRARSYTAWRCWVRRAGGFLPRFALLTRRSPGTKSLPFAMSSFHQYFGIDLELVWAIITRHVAGLAVSLEAVLNTLED